MSLDTSRRSAVVTGVSTGIGRAVAEALARAGWQVFGSVRKAKDAEDLEKALGGRFTPLIFDVTDDAAIAREAEKVRASLAGRTLSGLVNNAGVAVAGPLRYLPLDELRRQLDINLFGPIRVTQAFLPMLGADAAFAGAPGKIVNMSSVAGKIASPFMGPYAMSKHALEAMSESLRRELFVHGIDVVVVGPGAVKTPIWAKADEIPLEPYRNTEFGPLIEGMKKNMQTFGEQGIPAADVGNLVLDILSGVKTRPRYAILKNKFAMWTLPNLLPKRMVDRAVAKRFGIPVKNA